MLQVTKKPVHGLKPRPTPRSAGFARLFTREFLLQPQASSTLMPLASFYSGTKPSKSYSHLHTSPTVTLKIRLHPAHYSNTSPWSQPPASGPLRPVAQRISLQPATLATTDEPLLRSHHNNTAMRNRHRHTSTGEKETCQTPVAHHC